MAASNSPKRSKSRKSARRPKRAAKRSKPASRGVRRPARLSKPQRKAPARGAAKASRKAKPTRKPVSAQSGSRQAAARPDRTAAPAAAPTRKGKGLRIVLFGAGGMVGTRIAKEALSRGHHVVAVQRNPGGLDLDGKHVMTVQGDATDARSVAGLAKGADAVVSAVSPRNPPGAGTLPKAAKALLDGTRKAGVRRLVVVGGAGSLSVGPSTRLIDSPEFPAEYKPEAQEHVDALHVYRSEGQGVDWTFVSPPAMIQPGPRTGKYQVGQDNLLTAKDGQSHISAEDYAVALVDELEKGANKGRRMTVAWP
jgi:uncharacterized protein